MKYSNELKVGISVLVAICIIYFGLRFLQNIPLFDSSYSLMTRFENAEGLLNGNPVIINGFAVGTVTEVRLEPDATIFVNMNLDEGVSIPQGSHATVGGAFGPFGGSRVTIHLGPLTNPPFESGAFIPSEKAGMFGGVLEDAPAYLARVDSLFTGVQSTLEETRNQIANPQSDLRGTLGNLNTLTANLNTVLEAEKSRIDRILANIESASSEFNDFAAANSDSISVTFKNLNASLEELDRTLESVQAISGNVNALLETVRTGDGTLALLLNDPRLYNRLDSAAVNLNALLVDIRENPKKYLRELNVVDVF